MSLAYRTFNAATKSEKTKFERGIGPIIGSKRLISLKTIHSADTYYRGFILVLYIIAIAPILWVFDFKPDETAGFNRVLLYWL